MHVVTIGIADDDVLAASALEWFFQHEQAPIRVLWKVRFANDALVLCQKASTRPQVVLTDIRMQDMSGMALAKELHHSFPDIAVVGITAFTIDDIYEEALASGVSTILYKDCQLEDIVHAIGKAADDRNAMLWDGGSKAKTLLSDAELTVIREYAKGKTSLAIARSMSVSESTVKTYARRAYEKLNVHSRSEAVVECARLGVL